MARAGGLVLFAVALVLGASVVAGGYLVGHGFAQGRIGDDYVTVKGLAEREISADLATWALRFTATGDDLAAVQGKIEADGSAVRAFLTEAGFEPAEVQALPLEVTDLLAQSYRPEGASSSRFILAQTIIVRTANVQRVVDASGRIGALVKRGVALADTGGPRYVFTQLNAIKPGLIAEATRNARQAAAQFAKDSDATLGAIRRANQGVIEILGRDEFGMSNQGGAILPEPAQVQKKIRVVVTLDYRLES